MSIFEEVLAKLLNLSPDEFGELTKNPDTSELLSDDEIRETLLAKHKAKVDKIQEYTAAKAVRNNSSKIIRQLSSEFELSGVKTLDDAIQSLKSNLTSSTDDSPSDDNIDWKKALNLPEIQKKLNKLREDKEKAEQLLLQEQEGRVQDKVVSKLQSYASDLIVSKNAVLSEDKTMRNRQLKAFYSMLNVNDYKLNEDGELALKEELDEDTLEQISLDDFILSKSIFQYREESKDEGKPPKPKLPHPQSDKSGFTKEDLTAEGFTKKSKEYREAGNIEALEALKTAYMKEIGF